eukprot:6188358-Pleurochrysis_carterae.AAC.1
MQVVASACLASLQSSWRQIAKLPRARERATETNCLGHLPCPYDVQVRRVTVVSHRERSLQQWGGFSREPERDSQLYNWCLPRRPVPSLTSCRPTKDYLQNKQGRIYN